MDLELELWKLKLGHLNQDCSTVVPSSLPLSYFVGPKSLRSVSSLSSSFHHHHCHHHHHHRRRHHHFVGPVPPGQLDMELLHGATLAGPVNHHEESVPLVGLSGLPGGGAPVQSLLETRCKRRGLTVKHIQNLVSHLISFPGWILPWRGVEISSVRDASRISST